MNLKKSSLKKIVIFGQYKTGTTATFYKLLNSLPSNTRTLFEPEEYVEEDDDKLINVLAKVILAKPESVKYGGFENRNPEPNFDTNYYNKQNPDVLVSGLNTLVHYILFGIHKKREIKELKNKK